MTDTPQIPLSKLVAWEGNARRTMSEDGMAELEASIKAHGLLQSLVVIKDGKKYAVVAGARRLAAMQNLAKQGDIAADFAVPCQIVDDAKAAEANLAENTVRENMHPADQFEAFRKLIDAGKSIADVAAAFGVSDNIVEQRLRLARVSPTVLKAYRDEELNLEDVMAFAISDDHDRQDEVLADLPGYAGPREIRARLTENEVRSDDLRVRFVGLKAYEKAGGGIKRDLFSSFTNGNDEDDEMEGAQVVYLTNPALLDQLVKDKLEKATKPVTKEGWKWVEARAKFDYQESSKFRRIHPEKPPLSPELNDEVNKLEGEKEQLENAWYEADDDSEQPERIAEIEARLEEIEEARGEAAFTPEQIAIAGAVVTIDHKGKTKVERGLVLPEDMPKEKKAKASGDTGTHGDEPEERPELSASLIESLTAQRSAAISAALIARPDIGLIVVVHAMACQVFFDEHSGDHALQLVVKDQGFSRVEGSKALAKISASRETWISEIPGTPGELWDWLFQQNSTTLTALLAFCAAVSIDAVELKHNRSEDRLRMANDIAAALKLDMKDWFTPTVENYFSKVGKPQLLEAVTEVDATPPSNTMKKAELAKYAEQAVNGKGWLPKPLRAA